MKVNRWIVPVVVLVILFGSVGLGKAFGWWQTAGVKLSTVADVSPEDIRGSSSLADVSEAFGIPSAELIDILSIPADTPAETPLKELEAYNEVRTVRGLLAEHLGLPWEWPDEQEHAPSEPEPTAAAPAAPDTEHDPPTPPAAGDTLAAADIKGYMTLQDVSDQTGMPLDQLYGKLGLEEDVKPATALKDLRDQIAGFEVSVVREIVGEYQNQ